MADTPDVHPEAASGTGAAAGDEAKRFHQMVRNLRLPEDVSRVEFRFGEDSTGAPAVWIGLIAKDDLKPSKSKIARLHRVAEELRAMVHNESDRWPYVEVVTE